jgi:nucleoside-diphosphate-sugar epimerase
LLIIGCGDIGRRVAHLLRSRYRIYALTRDSARASELRTLGITPIIGDLDRPKSLSRLSGLAQLVLHFAPPQNSGAHDLHTRNLLTALNKSSILPHRLVFISTSGVYGDCSGALVRETQPVRKNKFAHGAGETVYAPAFCGCRVFMAQVGYRWSGC